MTKDPQTPPKGYVPQPELVPGQVPGIHERADDLVADMFVEEPDVTDVEADEHGVAEASDDDTVEITDN